MQVYKSDSLEKTAQIALKIAAGFKGGVIALTGELGAGKTTFTQYFAKALKVKDKIISPTFVLIRQHPLKNGSILFHVDLYRLESEKAIKSLGLEELWHNPKNIVLVEWAQKAKNLLPENTLWINFKTVDQNTKKISVTSGSR